MLDMRAVYPMGYTVTERLSQARADLIECQRRLHLGGNGELGYRRAVTRQTWISVIVSFAWIFQATAFAASVPMATQSAPVSPCHGHMADTVTKAGQSKNCCDTDTACAAACAAIAVVPAIPQTWQATRGDTSPSVASAQSPRAARASRLLRPPIALL